MRTGRAEPCPYGNTNPHCKIGGHIFGSGDHTGSPLRDTDWYKTMATTYSKQRTRLQKRVPLLKSGNRPDHPTK